MAPIFIDFAIGREIWGHHPPHLPAIIQYHNRGSLLHGGRFAVVGACARFMD